MLGATDGHAKNFSIALGPGGRFRLTPLYDVLSAQPSLDVGHIEQKQFKLAMSVGKNCHYLMANILPRHFLQTAALAGVGAPLLRAILENLAASVALQIDAVVAALPRDFPGQLVTSIRTAMLERARRLVEPRAEAAGE